MSHPAPLTSHPVLRRTLDLLFPPQCMSCGAQIERAVGLCADCWQQIHFIVPPLCARCGSPFDYELGEGALCGVCARTAARSYECARAALVYDDASRILVLRLKHADAIHTVPILAGWMAQAGGELLAQADLMVPVPAHWTRLLSRRYNQAALLARQLSCQGGPPLDTALLTRRRRTPSLGHLRRRERYRLLRNAFAVRHPERAAGRRVLLIDDVMTSGATVEACSRVLRAAGASAVDVLVLARVVL